VSAGEAAVPKFSSYFSQKNICPWYAQELQKNLINRVLK
jgi:hypothetical protein